MLRWVPKSYRGPLIAALVFHLSIFIALAVAARFDETARLDASSERNLVKVSVVSPPKPVARTEPKPQPKKPEPKPTPKPVEKKPEPKPQPKPEPKPEPKSEPKKVEPKPTPEPKKIEAPKSESPPEKVVARPTPKKEEKKEEEKKSFVLSPERSRELRPPKKTPVAEKAPSQDIPAPSKEEAPATQREVISGATSLKSLGLPDYYTKAALDKLSRFFQVPPDKEKDLTALLTCRIARDGTLSRIKISNSSGSTDLDRLAVNALERTERFNPFPDDFPKDYVDVEIAFYFKK